MKVLFDHHMKKQEILLWVTMRSEGWLKLLDIPMQTFEDVDLPIDSSDREVWRFAQKNDLILLTANRNSEGEETIRDENKPTSLPVVTVGMIDRMEESSYREKCAERLVDIVLDIESYLGVGRIYIPYNEIRTLSQLYPLRPKGHLPKSEMNTLNNYFNSFFGFGGGGRGLETK